MSLASGLAAATALAHAANTPSSVTFLPGTEPYHKTGYQSGTAWAVSVNNASNNYMTYGPYWTAPYAGDVTVAWTLLIDNNNNDNLPIVTLDVTDSGGNTVLGTMTVSRTQFDAAFVAQEFTLSVAVPAGASPLEFRVFYHCCSMVEHVKTVVTGPLDSGAFQSFWDRGSHFEYVTKHQFMSLDGPPGVGECAQTGRGAKDCVFETLTLCVFCSVLGRRCDCAVASAYCRAPLRVALLCCTRRCCSSSCAAALVPRKSGFPCSPGPRPRRLAPPPGLAPTPRTRRSQT